MTRTPAQVPYIIVLDLASMTMIMVPALNRRVLYSYAALEHREEGEPLSNVSVVSTLARRSRI
jgi:hypothetical protein